jgi:UDP-glucose 4-epimerase
VDEGAAEIVVLDDLSRGRLEHLAGASQRGRVTFVEGDICNAALVGDVMEGIDLVFHQAAIRITQCAEEPGRAVDVLVNGTARILEAAVAAKVKKVVAASSASVYGMADVFPTREDHHPYNNRTLYGAGKVFLEGMLRAFNDQYGLDYVALRYFNVFGPRMDTHGAYTEVFIRWMEEIENGRPPVIFGDGLQTMDFVFVEDVARANLCAAVAPATDRVYNVATGVEVSLRECAEKLPADDALAADAEVRPDAQGEPRAAADRRHVERGAGSGFRRGGAVRRGTGQGGGLVARGAKRGGLCMTR